MFKIDKRIEYALMALKHVHDAEPGALVTVRAICEAYKAPFDAMSRSMQVMARKGWLQSERGVGGGYHLNGEALAAVSLLDLIEAITGPVGVVNCLNTRMANCERVDACNIISPMLHLNETMVVWSRSVLLLDLLAGGAHADESVIKVDALTRKGVSAS